MLAKSIGAGVGGSTAGGSGCSDEVPCSKEGLSLEAVALSDGVVGSIEGVGSLEEAGVDGTEVVGSDDGTEVVGSDDGLEIDGLSSGDPVKDEVGVDGAMLVNGSGAETTGGVIAAGAIGGLTGTGGVTTGGTVTGGVEGATGSVEVTMEGTGADGDGEGVSDGESREVSRFLKGLLVAL